MKVTEFNQIYDTAKKVNIVNDSWFNCMGWFWINLTDKQLKKMYSLMLEQGAEEEIENNKTFIKLKNGLIIYKKI